MTLYPHDLALADECLGRAIEALRADAAWLSNMKLTTSRKVLFDQTESARAGLERLREKLVGPR